MFVYILIQIYPQSDKGIAQSPKNIRILGTRILRKVLKSEEGLDEISKDIINL